METRQLSLIGRLLIANDAQIGALVGATQRLFWRWFKKRRDPVKASTPDVSATQARLVRSWRRKLLHYLTWLGQASAPLSGARMRFRVKKYIWRFSLAVQSHRAILRIA